MDCQSKLPIQSVPITTDVVIRARCTTLCEKVCQWFSPGPMVSSNNKTDSHDITVILSKVALNTIRQANKSIKQRQLTIYSIIYDFRLVLKRKVKLEDISNMP